ncbi:MAG: insulinase family protein [Halanaerobiales bacterium]|nr:insulinase family protein [Halanaerobiales bacterium]
MIKTSEFNEYKTKNDIDLYVNKTDKFKTNYIHLDIIRPLSDQNEVSKNALIPYILYRGSYKYPTNQAISRELDKLFGADLNVSVARRGENQLLRFSIEIINDKFINSKENLTKKAIDFLYQLVFNPFVVDEKFKSDYVNKGRTFISEKILSLKNDKNSYVIERCYQEMCKDEKFSLYTLGTQKGLYNTRSDNLYTYYRKILKESPIEVFVIGDINSEEDIYNYINNNYKYDRDRKLPLNNTVMKTDHFNYVELAEEDNISQSRLGVGIRVPITRNHPLYFALTVYNGILGGFSHSKLFNTIRKEKGLAYYINTRLETTKGLILINAGINQDDYSTVKKIIKEKLAEIREGKVSKENIEWTKKKLISKYETLSDNNHSVVNAFLLGLINGKKDSLNFVINSIKQVKKEDIIKVAKMVQLTTYFLLIPGSDPN